MPIHNIPLAQTASARTWDKNIGSGAKDSLVVNALFEVSVNTNLGTKTVYVNKRPGSANSTSIGVSDLRLFKHYSDRFTSILSSDESIYSGNQIISGPTHGGSSFGGLPENINGLVAEAIINDLGVLAFVDGSGDGWYFWEDARSNNFPTFTGNRTSGQATITGLASTTGIYQGQAVAGSAIPSGTYVDGVLDSSRILLSQAVTDGAAVATTITKDAVAKIVDPHFPADANSMEFLDTRFHVGTDSGRIYQSAANNPASYADGEFVSADNCGDEINFIFKIANYIVAAGKKGTIQYFYNAGNPTGSVLSSADNLNVLGVTLSNKPLFMGGSGYCLASLAGPLHTFLCKISGVNQFNRVLDDVWNGITSGERLTQLGTMNWAESGSKDILLLYDISGLENRAIAYDVGNGSASLIELDEAILSAHNNIFTKETGTRLFRWDVNVNRDSGSDFTVTIQTEKQDPASGLSTTDIWADLLADNESSGSAELSVSDDDYQNWVSKGSFDLTKNKKRISALGFHDGPRAYRIQYTGNTNFRAQLMRVNYEPARR